MHRDAINVPKRPTTLKHAQPPPTTTGNYTRTQIKATICPANHPAITLARKKTKSRPVNHPPITFVRPHPKKQNKNTANKQMKWKEREKKSVYIYTYIYKMIYIHMNDICTNLCISNILIYLLSIHSFYLQISSSYLLAICSRCVGDVRMVSRWCLDDAWMMVEWCLNDVWMMFGWCLDD